MGDDFLRIPSRGDQHERGWAEEAMEGHAASPSKGGRGSAGRTRSVPAARPTTPSSPSMVLPGDKWLQSIFAGKDKGGWASSNSPMHVPTRRSSVENAAAPLSPSANRVSSTPPSRAASSTRPHAGTRSTPLRPVSGTIRPVTSHGASRPSSASGANFDGPQLDRPRTAPPKTPTTAAERSIVGRMPGALSPLGIDGSQSPKGGQSPSMGKGTESPGVTKEIESPGASKGGLEMTPVRRVSIKNEDPLKDTSASMITPTRTRNNRRVRLGGSLFDAANMHTAEGGDGGGNLSPSVSAMRDLIAGPEESFIPIAKMNEKGAAVWLEKWIDSFNAEAKTFKSPLAYTLTKLKELDVEAGMQSSTDPNGFRTAVCCHLLDLICPQLGPYRHVVHRIKGELARSIYRGVTNEELELPPGSRFHFEKSPYFFDNLNQQRTIRNIQQDLAAQDIKTAKAVKEAEYLRDEVESLSARVGGLKLRMHSAEVELESFKAEAAKREAQLLSEMQILRDKIIQGTFSSQVGGGDEGGGGLGADSELLEIFRREADRNAETELTNSALKDALGSCSTLVLSAVQATEEHVAAYEGEVARWQDVIMKRQNALLLHERGGKPVEELDAKEIMHRWLKYQVKCREKENAGNLFSDSSVPVANLTTALESGDVLLDAFAQVCDAKNKPDKGEVQEAKSIGLGAVFEIVAKAAHHITGDGEWRSVDWSNENIRKPLTLEMVAAVARAVPGLDQQVFGFAKAMHTQNYRISEELEKVRENYKHFMNKVQESLSTGRMLDVASVEMAVTSIGNVKKLLSEAWAHVKQVQQELDSIGQTWDHVVDKLVSYAHDSSIQKTKANDTIEQRAYSQGKEDGMLQIPSIGEDAGKTVIAPMKAPTTVEVAPGTLAHAKPTLPPATKIYLQNLTLEKLSDLAQKEDHESFVAALEKCAEFTVNYYDLLRKSFRHYCKIHHAGNNTIILGGACMSYEAWKALMSDIKIMGYDSNKKLSAKMCEDIFKKANIDIDPTTGRLVPGNRDLEAPEFIEGLVRIAAAVGHQNALELPFSYLQVVKMIVQYAKKERTDTFRRSCRDPQVQDVLVQYSDDLKTVYSSYSKLDTSADDILDLMNLQEFLLFAKDSGLVDSNLCQSSIVNIFIYVQDDDMESHHVSEKLTGENVETDRQLMFSEFCEALCGCACYKMLDPYFTLQQKLDFVCSRFVVPFATKVRRRTNRGNISESVLAVSRASRAQA